MSLQVTSNQLGRPLSARELRDLPFAPNRDGVARYVRSLLKDKRPLVVGPAAFKVATQMLVNERKMTQEAADDLVAMALMVFAEAADQEEDLKDRVKEIMGQAESLSELADSFFRSFTVVMFVVLFQLIFRMFLDPRNFSPEDWPESTLEEWDAYRSGPFPQPMIRLGDGIFRSIISQEQRNLARRPEDVRMASVSALTAASMWFGEDLATYVFASLRRVVQALNRGETEDPYLANLQPLVRPRGPAPPIPLRRPAPPVPPQELPSPEEYVVSTMDQLLVDIRRYDQSRLRTPRVATRPRDTMTKLLVDIQGFDLARLRRAPPRVERVYRGEMGDQYYGAMERRGMLGSVEGIDTSLTGEWAEAQIRRALEQTHGNVEAAARLLSL